MNFYQMQSVINESGFFLKQQLSSHISYEIQNFFM